MMPARYRARCLRVAGHADARAANPSSRCCAPSRSTAPALSCGAPGLGRAGRPPRPPRPARAGWSIEADSCRVPRPVGCSGTARAMRAATSASRAGGLYGAALLLGSTTRCSSPATVRSVLTGMVEGPPGPALERAPTRRARVTQSRTRRVPVRTVLRCRCAGAFERADELRLLVRQVRQEYVGQGAHRTLDARDADAAGPRRPSPPAPGRRARARRR